MAVIPVETAVSWFEDYEEASQDTRDTAEQCRDYYDNIQYTDEELAEYNTRKQPPVVKNRIKPKIDFMLGLERLERSDPRAFPRNLKDIEGAQAATDSIRYVMDRVSFDTERSLVFGNLIVEGTGGVELSVEMVENGPPRISVDHLQWDRIWYDHHSRRPDFKDAKYYGSIIWMDLDDAKDDWPDRQDDFDTMFQGISIDDTFDDAPRNKWLDSTRRRIRVARVWYLDRDGWNVGTFTGGTWLDEPILSPFVDEEGETEPGMLLQSSFVTRENDRYGMVWPLLSVQDAINHRESKALHLTGVRQTWGTKSSGLDTAAVKSELSKADGHIELPPGKKFGEDFGVLPTGDMADWQWRLLQEGKAEIDNIGAAPASSGKGQATSGRDRIAQQQGSKVEIGPVFDALRQWQNKVYKWTWGRIKQFWTEPMMIRITDDPKNAKFVGLNQPITRRQALEEQGVQITPVMAAHPLIDEVIGIRNNTAKLDVDIIVDDAPDTTTLVGEQFEQLVGLAQAGVMDIPPELIIEAGEFRNKDRLLEILEKRGMSGEENAAQAKELAQQQIQTEAAKAAAEIENTQADTEKKRSETMENLSQVREHTAEAVGKELAARFRPVPDQVTLTI